MVDKNLKQKLNWTLYKEIQRDTFELAQQKSSDYGTDSLTEFGTIGCLIRLNDKVNRLKNLIGKKKGTVLDETVEDTCLDIINYTIYIIMMEKKLLVEK